MYFDFWKSARIEPYFIPVVGANTDRGHNITSYPKERPKTEPLTNGAIATIESCCHHVARLLLYHFARDRSDF